ncbi:hypothetical protein [Phenylobacterium aquaticum]|uniref:hypothetical protein n=1 Tax=Phenylobacterium aquaticum TaxID=1763816 RepID=UPI0026EE70F6|nr:hypothetical protein [Phenylobacterium aquaticum]
MDSEKTKILLLGIGAAALLGLAAGGLVTPDFGALAIAQDAQPLPVRKPRGLGHALAANWTSFTGEIPDYVIGTDWATPGAAAAALQDEPAADEPAPRSTPVHVPTLAQVRLEAHASDAIAQADLPAAPPPSMGGDILAGLDSYAPPTPPDPGLPHPPAN